MSVAERRSTRNCNKDGWPLDCSGTSSDCCTLWGVELSGCCAEMAYGEGKKCHNPSGDNQELSFEASDHRFGYGRTEKWRSIHIPIWGERGVAAGCLPAAHVNQHVRLLAKVDSRHTVRTVLNNWIFARGNPITCRSWHPKTVTAEWNMGSWCWVVTTIGQNSENILWRDEAVFHIGGFVNRHNCHYWAAHDSEVTVEKMQNRLKVTVWCGVTATRVIGPYLLRDTMNAERYLQMLEDYVWPIVSGWENIDELVFMDDGAPPHFALSVRAWLDQKFPGRWLERREPHEWPARSPDLTPCDFFLWGWAKEELYRAKLRTMERLEYRIRNITNVPHDFLQKTGFHPRSFEEAGGCRRCLHWILSYASIFPF